MIPFAPYIIALLSALQCEPRLAFHTSKPGFKPTQTSVHPPELSSKGNRSRLTPSLVLNTANTSQLLSASHLRSCLKSQDSTSSCCSSFSNTSVGHAIRQKTVKFSSHVEIQAIPRVNNNFGYSNDFIWDPYKQCAEMAWDLNAGRVIHGEQGAKEYADLVRTGEDPWSIFELCCQMHCRALGKKLVSVGGTPLTAKPVFWEKKGKYEKMVVDNSRCNCIPSSSNGSSPIAEQPVIMVPRPTDPYSACLQAADAGRVKKPSVFRRIFRPVGKGMCKSFAKCCETKCILVSEVGVLMFPNPSCTTIKMGISYTNIQAGSRCHCAPRDPYCLEDA